MAGLNVISGTSPVLDCYVSRPGVGGVTGQTVYCTIIRSSDNRYWNGVTWQSGQFDNVMTERDPSAYPGQYLFTIALGAALVSGWVLDVQFFIPLGDNAFTVLERYTVIDGTATPTPTPTPTPGSGTTTSTFGSGSNALSVKTSYFTTDIAYHAGQISDFIYNPVKSIPRDTFPSNTLFDVEFGTNMQNRMQYLIQAHTLSLIQVPGIVARAT